MRWCSALNRCPEHRGVTSDLASAGCLMSDARFLSSRPSSPTVTRGNLRPQGGRRLRKPWPKRWNKTSDSSGVCLLEKERRGLECESESDAQSRSNAQSDPGTKSRSVMHATARRQQDRSFLAPSILSQAQSLSWKGPTCPILPLPFLLLACWAPGPLTLTTSPHHPLNHCQLQCKDIDSILTSNYQKELFHYF